MDPNSELCKNSIDYISSFQRISAVHSFGIHALIILSCVEINGRFTLDHAWKGWRWDFSCHPSKLLLPPKTNIFCPAKLSLLTYYSPFLRTGDGTGSFETGAVVVFRYFPPLSLLNLLGSSLGSQGTFRFVVRHLAEDLDRDDLGDSKRYKKKLGG